MKRVVLQVSSFVFIFMSANSAMATEALLAQSFSRASNLLKPQFQELRKSVDDKKGSWAKLTAAAEPAQIVPGVYKAPGFKPIDIVSWASQLLIKMNLSYGRVGGRFEAFIEPDPVQGIKRYIGTGTIVTSCAVSDARVEIFPIKEAGVVKLFVKVLAPLELTTSGNTCAFQGVPSWFVFERPFEYQVRPIYIRP